MLLNDEDNRYELDDGGGVYYNDFILWLLLLFVTDWLYIYNIICSSVEFICAVKSLQKKI